MDIEYCNELCGCDQLRIDEEREGRLRLVERLCGINGAVVWTSSNTARLRFRSDNMFNYRSFRLHVQEAYPGRCVSVQVYILHV